MFQKNFGVKSQISEVFQMFQMSNDICLLPDNSVEGLAFVFLLIHEKGGKEMERTDMWLWEHSCCTTLLQIAVFFFFGSEWSWLSRTVLSWLWGMILVIQTWTGRVLSKFTVLLSQLRLFWLEIWKLMMVLVFFLCVGCFLDFWLGIVQNDWFTGKTQLIPEQKVNGQTRGN